MGKNEPNVEEIEAIGNGLPKSKKTEEFIEAQAIGKKGKIIPNKSKKTASGIKVKTMDDFTADKPMVPPPERVRVTIPAGEIIYLYPGDLDNLRHQPRDMHKKIPPVDPAFTEELRTTRGNLQAILAQKAKVGQKPVVIDGHRRIWSLRNINEGQKSEDRLLAKVELIDVNDAEAAVLAYRLNITAERLTDTERDRWVYEMMATYGMTGKQVTDATGLSKATVSNIRRVFEQSPEPVMKALDEGDISTGHAKAIVSLPPKVQEGLVKSAIKRKLKEDPISVREMEQEAKIKRNEESIIERLTSHIETKYVKKQDTPVYLEIHDVEKFRTDVFNNVFPQGTSARYGIWTDGTQEVKRAMTRAGFRLRLKPTAPIEKREVSLCLGCIAYAKAQEACIWTGLEPEVKPPMYGKCPKHLPGKPMSLYNLVACPYCDVPIWDPKIIGGYPSSGNLNVNNEVDFNADYVDPNLTERRVVHAWCFIQEFVKTERLEGICADCSFDECDLIGTLSRMRSLEDHHEVSKCPLQQKGYDLTKINKAVLDTWNEKRQQLLDELKEEEEKAKLAEAEKAEAKAKSEAKKLADAKAKAKAKLEKEKVKKAKAQAKADAKAKAEAEKKAKVKAKEKAKAEAKKLADAKAKAKAKLEKEKVKAKLEKEKAKAKVEAEKAKAKAQAIKAVTKKVKEDPK